MHPHTSCFSFGFIGFRWCGGRGMLLSVYVDFICLMCLCWPRPFGLIWSEKPGGRCEEQTEGAHLLWIQAKSSECLSGTSCCELFLVYHGHCALSVEFPNWKQTICILLGDYLLFSSVFLSLRLRSGISLCFRRCLCSALRWTRSRSRWEDTEHSSTIAILHYLELFRSTS